jgi:hypothetical protein
MQEQLAAGMMSHGSVDADTCIQFLRHQYAALCPYVADLTAAAASQMSQDMASRFLATIRVPAAPTEDELAALAVLVAKADEANVGLFLSTGNSFDQDVRNTVLSLFSSLPVSRHPLKPFASFIAEIGAEVKRSPDMALALLRYDHPLAFTTWDAADLARVLGTYTGYPSPAQHEMLNLLDILDADGRLPVAGWEHVLHDLERQAYMERAIQPTHDELEVARRRAKEAACVIPIATRSQVRTLPPRAIILWMNPRCPPVRKSKDARHCNFDELATIMRNLDALPDETVLDRVISWRQSRGSSLLWKGAPKNRLLRNTQILCLMRLARWDPLVNKWTVPHQLIQRTGSIMPTAAPGSLWS